MFQKHKLPWTFSPVIASIAFLPKENVPQIIETRVYFHPPNPSVYNYREKPQSVIAAPLKEEAL